MTPRARRPDPLAGARTGALTAARNPAPPSMARAPAGRHALLELQRTAGNRAVAGLLVQRLAHGHAGPCPAPPAAPTAAAPASDPAFAGAVSGLRAKQKLLTAHPAPAAEAKAAQDAAVAPPDDRQAQGKAAQADTMAAAKPKGFNKAAFIAAVNKALAAQSPKTLEEADNYAESGKADAIKNQVSGQVTAGKKASAHDIETTTKAPPDLSKAVTKPVTPLAPARPPGKPAPPSAAAAAPKPAPAAQVRLGAGSCEVDQQMAAADVDDQQLKEANEPQFAEALATKQEVAEHDRSAPAAVRAAEAKELASAKAAAGQSGQAATAAMHGTRVSAGQQVAAGKGDTKTEDEQRRSEATAKLQKVFDTTKAEVEGILTGLDTKVEKQFDAGEQRIRAAFKADVKRRMKAYKDKRYEGWLRGGARWLKDKLKGLPAEANRQVYLPAKQAYERQMQQLVGQIADTIAAELKRAKDRIAKGRAELKAEVAKLPKDLRAYGREAAQGFASEFVELSSAVDSKADGLVEQLAKKYAASRTAVDDEIKKMQAENQGLVDKAKNAVKAVVGTILELKDKLMAALGRAASVVGKIIKAPIKFLGNLIRGVKGGLQAFLSKAEQHFKKGLLGWLLGVSSSAGIELPSKFDLKGILKLLATLVGLTWATIRQRIIKKGVPAKAMAAAEQSVPLVQALQKDGVGGIWNQIAEKVGNLKEKIFGDLAEAMVPSVLIAGIKWIVSLLNPASAAIKCILAIVNILQFVVTRAAQIVEFVNAVLDAVVKIASGAVGGAAKAVENALARSVPVLIGFLAALLGVGGIANKVKKVFQAASKPVKRAVDWVVGKIVKTTKSLWTKLKAKFGKRGRNGEKEHQKGASASIVIDQRKSFVMNGAAHTLFAKTQNGRIIIEMASRRFNLEILLRSAEDEAGKCRKKGLVKALKRVREVFSRAEHLSFQMRAATIKATKRVEDELQLLLTKAAGMLADVGRNFGLKSLRDIGHPSQWVTAESELKHEYRGKKFRQRVYGGWNSANKPRGSFRRRSFRELRDKMLADVSRWRSEGKFKLPRSYYCPRGDHIADAADLKRGALSLDHPTSVVTHWQSGGNDCGHDERHIWYNKDLVPMCISCNVLKGSGEEEPKSYRVTRKFRGRGEGVAQ